MLVTNGQLWSTVTIGNNSSNNTATVLGNATWNLLAGTSTIGTGTAISNSLTLLTGSTYAVLFRIVDRVEYYQQT